MSFDFKSGIALAALMCSASHALAVTRVGEWGSFSGFGTLGIAETDTKDVQYVRDRQRIGATTNAEFGLDTNLGLQLVVQPTKWLSGAVQVLTQQREERNLTTEVEWAYAKVKLLDNLSIRGGRMALPMFMVSDARNVGYANTWLRPPDETYALAVFHSLEGGDISYTQSIGSDSVTLSLLGGKSSFYIFIPGEPLKFDVKKLKGVNLLWETDWGSVRLGHVDAEPQVGIPGEKFIFTGIGATVDHNNIVAQGEFVERRSSTDGVLINANGWYVLGGYRFGTVLPYVSYSDTKPRDTGPAFHFSEKQSTFAAGIRWDAFESAALKLQLQRVDTHDTSGISFLTPAGLPATLPITDPVYVGSLAVDFVL